MKLFFSACVLVVGLLTCVNQRAIAIGFHSFAGVRGAK